MKPAGETETMLCVGGPVAGRRANVAADAESVAFADHGPAARSFDPDAPFPETVPVAVYKTMTLAASAEEQFRILVPAGTGPAQALRWLIDGYKQERELEAAEFWGPELGLPTG